jgi:hypothetical protein
LKKALPSAIHTLCCDRRLTAADEHSGQRVDPSSIVRASGNPQGLDHHHVWRRTQRGKLVGEVSVGA